MKSDSMEERTNYSVMISFFGGDGAATRATNALWREHVRSMYDLEALASKFSDQGFREYLDGLWSVGVKSRDCIVSGLRRFREEEAEMASDPDGAVRGFRRRLYWTALRQTDPAAVLFPDVKDGDGNDAGLTPDDLVLLSRLFGQK